MMVAEDVINGRSSGGSLVVEEVAPRREGNLLQEEKVQVADLRSDRSAQEKVVWRKKFSST
jgi:hypothetical protein